MKKVVTLHPAMGQAVLNHLCERVALPTTGVLAGQAVASALMDLYGHGGGVYNDFDVFQSSWEDGPKAVGASPQSRLPRRTISTVEYGIPHVRTDPYGHTSYVATRASYRILSSRKDGLINTVKYDMASYGTPLNRAACIIRGFDLNCTRVAVDLVNKQLVWAPDFEKFLNTYQLEIVNLQTPYHTALRFVKKLKEMPLYGDIPLSMEIVSAIMGQYEYGETTNYDRLKCLRKRFGREHAKQYVANASELEPYFSLVSKGQGLFTLKPKGMPGEDLVSIMLAQCSGALHLGATCCYRHRLKQSANTAKKMALVESQDHWFFRSSLAALGPAYVQGQVTDRHFSEIGNVVAEHQDLDRLLLGLTLPQQREVVQRLKHFARREGEWVFGVAETAATQFDVLSDSSFTHLLEHEKADYLAPLTTPLLGSALKLGNATLLELLTRADLMQEGKRMRHCVGGYAHSVQTGKSRIFSIRTGDGLHDQSTVELAPRKVKDGSTYYRVVQHRTFRNATPSWRHQMLGAFLLMYINGHLAFLDVKADMARQRGQLRQAWRRVVREIKPLVSAEWGESKRIYLGQGLPSEPDFKTGPFFDEMEGDIPF